MKQIEISQIRKGNKVKTNSTGVHLYISININIPSRYHEFDVETSSPALFFTWSNYRSGIMSELKKNSVLAKQLVFSHEGSDEIREINDNYDVPLIISRRAEVMITKSIEFPTVDYIGRGYAAGMDFEPGERYKTIGKFLEKYIASVPEIIRDIETACYQLRFPGVNHEAVVKMLADSANFATWLETTTGKLEAKMQALFNAPVKIKIAKHEQVPEYTSVETMRNNPEYAELISSNDPFALHVIVFAGNNPLNWLRVTILPRPQQQLFKPESELPLLILDYSPNPEDQAFNTSAMQFKSELETAFNLTGIDESKIFPQFTEADIF